MAVPIINSVYFKRVTNEAGIHSPELTAKKTGIAFLTGTGHTKLDILLISGILLLVHIYLPV